MGHTSLCIPSTLWYNDIRVMYSAYSTTEVLQRTKAGFFYDLWRLRMSFISNSTVLHPVQVNERQYCITCCTPYGVLMDEPASNRMRPATALCSRRGMNKTWARDPLGFLNLDGANPPANILRTPYLRFDCDLSLTNNMVRTTPYWREHKIPLWGNTNGVH